MISSSLIMIWGLGAIVTACAATLLFWKPLATIIHEALPEKVASAFTKVFTVGVFAISLLSGVGSGTRNLFYGGTQDTSVIFVNEVFSGARASSLALFTYFSVIFFVLLVSHVGLARARSDAGKA